MSDLWTTAGAEREAEVADRAFLQARHGLDAYWPTLAAAESVADYDVRRALIAEAVDRVVDEVSEHNGVERIALFARLDRSLQLQYALARTAEKARLECMECNKVFTKNIGPRTYEVKCPRCGGYDVDVALGSSAAKGQNRIIEDQAADFFNRGGEPKKTPAELDAEEWEKNHPKTAAMIEGDDFEAIKSAVEPLDTPELRTKYENAEFDRAEITRDVDKRYRWDLYWKAVDSGALPYAGGDIKDAHIDTALRKIVPKLGSKTAENINPKRRCEVCGHNEYGRRKTCPDCSAKMDTPMEIAERHPGPGRPPTVRSSSKTAGGSGGKVIEVNAPNGDHYWTVEFTNNTQDGAFDTEAEAEAYRVQYEKDHQFTMPAPGTISDGWTLGARKAADFMDDHFQIIPVTMPKGDPHTGPAAYDAEATENESKPFDPVILAPETTGGDGASEAKVPENKQTFSNLFTADAKYKVGDRVTHATDGISGTVDTVHPVQSKGGQHYYVKWDNDAAPKSGWGQLATDDELKKEGRNLFTAGDRGENDIPTPGDPDWDQYVRDMEAGGEELMRAERGPVASEWMHEDDSTQWCLAHDCPSGMCCNRTGSKTASDFWELQDADSQAQYARGYADGLSGAEPRGGSGIEDMPNSYDEGYDTGLEDSRQDDDSARWERVGRALVAHVAASDLYRRHAADDPNTFEIEPASKPAPTTPKTTKPRQKPGGGNDVTQGFASKHAGFEDESDWSGGWARTMTEKSHPYNETGRGKPESWGDYNNEAGEQMRLYRGPNNKVRAITPDGDVLWEESNVAPAIARAAYEGWADTDSSPFFQRGLQDEVRRNTSFGAKIEEIADSVQRTNPGMNRAAALALATKTVERFPKVADNSPDWHRGFDDRALRGMPAAGPHANPDYIEGWNAANTTAEELGEERMGVPKGNGGRPYSDGPRSITRHFDSLATRHTAEVDESLVQEEYERFNRSPDWELNNINKALNMMPFMNGPQEEARLEAVRRIRQERKQRRGSRKVADSDEDAAMRMPWKTVVCPGCSTPYTTPDGRWDQRDCPTCKGRARKSAGVYDTGFDIGDRVEIQTDYDTTVTGTIVSGQGYPEDYTFTIRTDSGSVIQGVSPDLLGAID